MAKENYVSTSTIMRLSKKIGYTGYIDMIYNLKKYSTQNLKNKMIMDLNFTNAIKFEAPEDVDKLIDILKNGSVAVLGQGFSNLIAQYIYRRFII
jgi:DNA-binding MurR/RpiR family transcriptional regulator